MTVTPDGAPAADGRARAAARLRGAAQALHALGHRPPADQQRASLFALHLLGTRAGPANWAEAGLPEPPSVPAADNTADNTADNAADSTAESAADSADQQPPGPRLPLDDRAVVLLAGAAMDLHAAGLGISERPSAWERLAGFFAGYLPETAPELLALRERARTARADAQRARIRQLPGCSETAPGEPAADPAD